MKKLIFLLVGFGFFTLSINAQAGSNSGDENDPNHFDFKMPKKNVTDWFKSDIKLDDNGSIDTTSTDTTSPDTSGGGSGFDTATMGAGIMALGALASASKSKSLTKLVGVASLGMGGVLLKQGLAPCPKACIWQKIFMGVAGLAQGANALKHSKENGKKQMQLTQNVDTPNPEGNLASVATTEGDFSADVLAQIPLHVRQRLKKNNIKINKGTISGGGKNLSFKEAGNLATVAKAFNTSPEHLAALKKDLAKISAKVQKKFAAKGPKIAGAFSSKPTSTVIEEDEDYLANMGQQRLAKNRYVASAKGLSKKLGDSLIGVKGDSIFKIINRSYKNQQKILLKQ